MEIQLIVSFIILMEILKTTNLKICKFFVLIVIHKLIIMAVKMLEIVNRFSNCRILKWSTRTDCEGVAQLARASDCRSEGCGIVPHLPRQNLLPSGFAGSNPAPATSLIRIEAVRNPLTVEKQEHYLHEVP